jgi:hypothetical protein
VLTLSGVFAIIHVVAHPGGASQVFSGNLQTRHDPLDAYPLQTEVAEALRNSGYPPCGVLTDNNYVAVALQRRSKFRPVMLWSPEAAFLFQESLAATEVRRRLREKNIMLVSFAPETANFEFLRTIPFYRDDNAAWEPVVVLEQAQRTEVVAYLPPVDSPQGPATPK